MEDEDYVRALAAILTGPQVVSLHPDGVADDGIDRLDGFGRDVWVESLALADGEHGAEVVVEFALAVPPGEEWRGVPPRASLRLPVDAEWRELSGYADPASYAPVVAWQVEGAATSHVRRHVTGTADPSGRAGGLRALPGREEQWQLLLGALRLEGDVRELAPGRIELTDPEGSVVTVVVTPDEWERVLAQGATNDFDLYVGELLGPRDEDETFVVFFDGDLRRSTREKLPPVRGRAFERRMAEVRAQHPVGQGSWQAFAPGGPPQ